MKFLRKEISDAYYASSLPLESVLAYNDEYRCCLQELTIQHEQLRTLLSPEQYCIAESIFHNIGTQLDMECRFYFQSGWLAAERNNE